MFFDLFKKKVQMKEDTYASLCEADAYLDRYPQLEFDPQRGYEGCILRVLDTLESDMDYMKNHEKLEGRPIEDMSLNELATMYTFIIRGERFSDGHIASYINDGTIKKLIHRHIEIIKNEYPEYMNMQDKRTGRGDS